MNILLLMGTLVIIALYTGRLFSKIKFPPITGYIIVGFILGNFHIFSSVVAEEFSGIVFYVNTIAISFLLFETGAELEKSSFKGGKKIIAIAFIQSLITFLLILVTFIMLFNFPLPISVLIAAIGIPTAPDIVLLTIRNDKARGRFVEILKEIVVIDDLIAELFFFILFPICKNILEHYQNPVNVIKFSLEEIIVSILLGIIAGFLFSLFSREFRQHRIPPFAGTIGFIILTIGVSILIKAHTIIVILIMGIIFSNTSKNREVVLNAIMQIDSILFILFLIVNGSALSFELLKETGLGGVAFISSRFMGKILGGITSSKTLQIKEIPPLPLGMSLLPQSTISIYFASHAKELLLIEGETIFAITMSGVIFFEILGAPLLSWTLRRKTHPPATGGKIATSSPS